jgi:hypothetical protein
MTLLRVGPCVMVVMAMTACGGPELDETDLATGALGDASTCVKQSTTGATASGDDGNRPGNAIDGSLETRWSNQGLGSSLTIDLGAARRLCSLRIASYRATERRLTLVFDGSTDGRSFTALGGGTTSGRTGFDSFTLSTPPARFVRITVTGNTQNTWASLTEVELLGGPVPPPDAGAPVIDAGSPRPDAGTPSSDAGTPTPVPGAKPGPSTTGPAGTLREVGSLDLTTDGQVVENVFVRGRVKVMANNVRLKNFRIDAGGRSYGIDANGGFRGAVFEDGEILNVSSAAIFGGGFTARRLDLHESDGDGLKVTTDALVEGCWIHHLGRSPSSHADGNQSRHGGADITFRGNFCDMPIGLSGYKSNSCFIIEPDGGAHRRFLIENNWLNGGNYTLYCSNEDVTVRGNRFGRNFRYGIRNGCRDTQWTTNVWDDTGAPAN